MRERGAKWKHEGYKPHVTISYDPTGMDKATPWTGPIHFGPERFEEITKPFLKALFKAQIAGGAGGALFSAPVHVKTQMTKDGVLVPSHLSTG